MELSVALCAKMASDLKHNIKNYFSLTFYITNEHKACIIYSTAYILYLCYKKNNSVNPEPGLLMAKWFQTCEHLQQNLQNTEQSLKYKTSSFLKNNLTLVL